MRRPTALLVAAAALAGCGAPSDDGDEEFLGWLQEGLRVCPTGATVEGVDVARYQPNTDWARVKRAGIAFAIIKATEGTTYTNPFFARDWSGTAANDIIHGAYHFFRPGGDPTAQADHFVQVAGVPGDGELPLVLDLEVTDSLAGPTVVQKALTFLQRLEQKTGRTPIVYTSPYFFNTTLGNPVGWDRYHLWVANWDATCPSLPDAWTTWPFWQYSDSGSVDGISTAVDLNKFNGDLQALRRFAGVRKPLAHGNSNDAITAVNWPDGHVELFATTPGGQAVHTYAAAGADTWAAPTALDDGAACGMAASFWGGQWNYPELFAPLAGGGTGHLWWASNAWGMFQDLGGAGAGLSHLSTLVRADGTTEVFALGSDGAMWHNGWTAGQTDWPGWSSLGGSLATGAGAILWEDGHAELFATDEGGVAWHDWSGNYPGGWHGWLAMGGLARLASRPVPARWADGHVEVFARGVDGQLYHSAYQGAAWTDFAAVGGAARLAGDPSVVASPADAGAERAGPSVFARDVQGRVLHLAWDGTGFTDLAPLGTLHAASDPLAWVREDGTLQVFAVDTQGRLMKTRRDASGAWSAWSRIGDGFAPCAAPVEPDAPDGGAPAPDLEAGNPLIPPPDPKAGCACTVGGGDAPLGPALLLVLVAVARSRRKGSDPPT